ncbi:MAG TPA: hypothetical protein VK034_01315 [Enhygromyxa sp.]|nr:hypothetical protein [Enhygromyxa sp.]
MRYQRLFAVEIRHAYLGGERCGDLGVEPSPECTSALLGHRLVARPRVGGIEVFAPLDAQRQPFVPLAAGLQLRFDLRVRKPEFAGYTDSSAWAHLAHPTWRGSGSGGGELELGEGEVDEHGRAPPRFRQSPDLLGALVIAGVGASWLASPPTFALTLASPSLRWIYYLTTTRQSLDTPRIEDGEPDRGLSFTGEPLSPDNVDPGTDPLGSRLLARDPARSCFRLISAEPLALSRTPRRGLALHLGLELLIGELPNPSIRDFTTLTLEPDAEPQVSLYRVLEY